MLAIHLPLATSVFFSFDFLGSRDPFSAHLQYQKDAFFNNDRIELTKNDLSSGRLSYARASGATPGGHRRGGQLRHQLLICHRAQQARLEL